LRTHTVACAADAATCSASGICATQCTAYGALACRLKGPPGTCLWVASDCGRPALCVYVRRAAGLPACRATTSQLTSEFVGCALFQVCACARRHRPHVSLVCRCELRVAARLLWRAMVSSESQLTRALPARTHAPARTPLHHRSVAAAAAAAGHWRRRAGRAGCSRQRLCADWLDLRHRRHLRRTPQ
jgi:hypothetical protein